MMDPRFASAMALSGLLAWSACGPPPAPAAHPAPPASTPAISAPAPKPAAYQRDRDPMAASFDAEKNPFTRLIVARMWAAVARAEDGEGTLRGQTAQRSVDQAQEALAQVLEPCAREAREAMEWAEATKQSLERRYLNSVDLLGEQNVGTRAVDAQVTVLRDELDVLERRTRACPKQYFGPGER